MREMFMAILLAFPCIACNWKIHAFAAPIKLARFNTMHKENPDPVKRPDSPFALNEDKHDVSWPAPSITPKLVPPTMLNLYA